MFKAITNNQQELEIEIKGDQFIIDGRTAELDIIKIDENNFHVLKENISFIVEILKVDKLDKKFIFRVNGTEYSVSLKDNADILLNKLGLSSSIIDIASEVKAPMPGLILDVFIHEGMEIKKGEPLLILEAMKMENILKSPRDGVIKSILITKGKSVEKNQILIKF